VNAVDGDEGERSVDRAHGGRVAAQHASPCLIDLHVVNAIQPGIEQIVAVALDWSQVGDDASRRIADGLEEADSGDGAVILTDMFGGTPTNLTLPFLKRDRVEIVTGVNLPMLLKCAALQKSGKPVVEIAHVAKDRGQRSIYVASDLLADAGAVDAAKAGETS
jgi:PTS system mannose-specific IIA component